MKKWADARSKVMPQNLFYDKGMLKIVVLACLVIFLSVLLTGIANYRITRNEIVKVLKQRNLVYVVDSIDARISSRIDRAKETTLLLARDPLVIEWMAGGELDGQLGDYAKGRIDALAKQYDYSSAFLVSATTRRYFGADFRIKQKMERNDPGAKWFFDMLESGREVCFDMSYNAHRKDSFLYVDALVGSAQHPVGVAGVAVNLQMLAREFSKFKFSSHSNLWLIDQNGAVYLSDDDSVIGRPLSDFVPYAIFTSILDGMGADGKARVYEYETPDGDTMDLVSKVESSTGRTLVYQIPRRESIVALSGIQGNTAIASLFAVLLMVCVFYFASYRIANPLRLAKEMTQALERRVEERTHQLAEKNQEIMDSIAYAQTLQEGVLVTKRELSALLGAHFVLWRPRDLVGGDFYWVHASRSGGCYVALADCTGHGVPGALMTMALNAVLDHAVDRNTPEPDALLVEINSRMREILHRNSREKMRDDGLDIAVCRIEGNVLTFAGANLPLYVRRGDAVQMIKGDRMSVGYRSSREDFAFTLQRWEAQAGDIIYLTSDGYIDQNGGAKDFAFGRRRFMELLAALPPGDMELQKDALEDALQNYMEGRSQRDDITVLGVQLRQRDEEKQDEEEIG